MARTLREPSAGPLVGHTTSTFARIWMRAADDTDLRTVGVAALFDPTNRQCIAGTARYFRLHREFDRTGTVDFDGLAPDTRHEVRLGSLLMDSLDPELIVNDEELFARLPLPDVWLAELGALPRESSGAAFTTFPRATKGFTFLFGSCRYPGVLGANKRADEIFRAMAMEVKGDPRTAPRLVLMVGDQIYADRLNRIVPLARARTSEQFHDRYLEAFTTPYFRELTSSVPTYMILDDHEIEDNWVQTRTDRDSKSALFQEAIHAYSSYQWLHGPRTYGRKFYYKFDYGTVPFFVLDERTARTRDEDAGVRLQDNHLLGPPGKSGYKGQLDHFLDWLIERKDFVGPKFVVSSSVFAPSDVADVKRPWKSDSWPAYPETRRAILKTIVEHGIQDVVFLCGDVHCSCVAEIWFERDGGRLPIRTFSITSSAFYWPWPFADGDPLSFVHDSKVEGDEFEIAKGLTMQYRASAFEQADNYTAVTWDGAAGTLHVQPSNKDGERLERATTFNVGGP